MNVCVCGAVHACARKLVRKLHLTYTYILDIIYIYIYSICRIYIISVLSPHATQMDLRDSFHYLDENCGRIPPFSIRDFLCLPNRQRQMKLRIPEVDHLPHISHHLTRLLYGIDAADPVIDPDNWEPCPS